MDEFSPTFTQTHYAFRVPYKAAIGDIVGVVYATDKDEGVDGQINYSFKVMSSVGGLRSAVSMGGGLLFASAEPSTVQSRSEIIPYSHLGASTRRGQTLRFSASARSLITEGSIFRRWRTASKRRVFYWVTSGRDCII